MCQCLALCNVHVFYIRANKGHTLLFSALLAYVCGLEVKIPNIICIIGISIVLLVGLFVLSFIKSVDQRQALMQLITECKKHVTTVCFYLNSVR
jgi:hypothetical protein